MAKGGVYEREVCKQLSLWWTGGKRDDIFWRTAGSGARATVRSKRGKKTFGQYGDVLATDPIGQPFLKVVTVEIKKGYNKTTVHSVLDKPSRWKTQIVGFQKPRTIYIAKIKEPTKQQWERFVEQSSASAKEAGTPYWLLIHRRDNRETTVFMPIALWSKLFEQANILDSVKPRVLFLLAETMDPVVGCQWKQFLSVIKPKHFKRIAKRKVKKT